MGWKMRIGLVAIAGGTLLGFVKVFIDYVYEDPWFTVFSIAMFIGTPLVAYEFGRWRERVHAREQRQIDYQLFLAVSGKTGGKVIDGVVSPGNSFSMRNRPLYVNGSRLTPPMDYESMCDGWIKLGYPTFTRDSLKALGAKVGSNENYTILTALLQRENLIQRQHGKTDIDEVDDAEHQLYRWCDENGKDYTKGQLLSWHHDFEWNSLNGTN